MKTINNTVNSISLRKNLRNNATPQEILLWLQLKDKQLGYKFRRQHGVGSYVLDFYCPEKLLAIEIDGSQHYEEAAVDYDQKRTELLSRYGIQVLRFTNGDINTNIISVIDEIQRILESPPLTPPR